MIKYETGGLLAIFSFVFAVVSATFAVAQHSEETMQKVSFKNGGIDMAGILHFPTDFDTAKKYSAIVCVNAAGAVKEQSAGLHAKRLAKHGFVVLTFDASHQGESGGEPRFLESPPKRVEDIRKAVDYLTTLPFVDRECIGAFGVCAGAGYAINAAMTDRRIKAVATASATDAGAVMREGWLGDTPVAEQIKTLEEVSRLRTAEANGAPAVYGPYVPEPIDGAATSVTMREAYEYYRTPRGAHPRSENKVLATSLDQIFGFSAFYLMDSLFTQPLLCIVGSESDVLYLSKRAVELAKGEKELLVLEGATHVDLYDRPKYLDVAEESMSRFFAKNLSPATK